MKRTFIFGSLLMWFPLVVFSQLNYVEKNTSLSMGYSLLDEQLPEGFAYTPLSMLASFTVWNKKHFSVYAETQFAQALIPPELELEFELGINLGIAYQVPISQRLSMSGAIGTGPHFITVDTRRQADGFIFSDNFELGVFYRLKEFDTLISVRGRYRHVSNAGLQSPNGGIDNFFMVFGIVKEWKK